MNNISTYSILTTKKMLNTHFVFFCLLHSPVGFSLIGLQQHQPIYLDSIFHLGKVLTEPFAMFIKDCSLACGKNFMGKQKMKVQ